MLQEVPAAGRPGRTRARSLWRAPVQMPELRQGLRSFLGSAAPHARPHRSEAIYVHRVRQVICWALQPQQAPACALWREAFQMRGVFEVICGVLKPAQTRKNSPRWAVWATAAAAGDRGWVTLRLHCPHNSPSVLLYSLWCYIWYLGRSSDPWKPSPHWLYPVRCQNRVAGLAHL